MSTRVVTRSLSDFVKSASPEELSQNLERILNNSNFTVTRWGTRMVSLQARVAPSLETAEGESLIIEGGSISLNDLESRVLELARGFFNDDGRRLNTEMLVRIKEGTSLAYSSHGDKRKLEDIFNGLIELHRLAHFLKEDSTSKIGKVIFVVKYLFRNIRAFGVFFKTSPGGESFVSFVNIAFRKLRSWEEKNGCKDLFLDELEMRIYGVVKEFFSQDQKTIDLAKAYLKAYKTSDSAVIKGIITEQGDKYELLGQREQQEKLDDDAPSEKSKAKIRRIENDDSIIFGDVYVLRVKDTDSSRGYRV